MNRTDHRGFAVEFALTLALSATVAFTGSPVGVANAISRASVVTPGSSTSRSLSHRTSSLKITFGPSPLVHERAAIHSRNYS